MIDLDRIEGFEWDDGNRSKSEDKHGVTQPEAEQALLNEPLVVAVDPAHSAVESRFHALGRSDAGRRLHVTFTLRQCGTRIRVISARDMSRKERAFHDEYDEEA
ncbi:MAG: BrnT family toxin [Alphaproteobacteria bacterium]